MQQKLYNFASAQGLVLTPGQVDLLLQYAQLVWQKKEQLNLTSVANPAEIITRHICDGLAAAAVFRKQMKNVHTFSAADMGSGA